jgi:hypothetical protein
LKFYGSSGCLSFSYNVLETCQKVNVSFHRIETSKFSIKRRKAFDFQVLTSTQNDGY